MAKPRDSSVESGSEPRLRQQGETARALIETAPDAMLVVDSEGRIELVNGQVERLFGYPRAELVGHPVEILVPGRLRGGHRRHRAAYAAEPSLRPMGSGLDLAGRRKDGSEFPVEISLSPLEAGGRPLISAVIRDVSERKRIERELRAARNEAEHASRDKSSFLAAASHDLRQPLQAARFYLEILESELAAELEEMPPSLGKLNRCLESLRGLLNRLLDLSKLDAGSLVPQRRRVRTDVLLERLTTEMKPLAIDRGLELRTAGPRLLVESDPALLERILKNLISNAIRFTRRGGVLLAVRRREGRIAIQIWDTGIGIPAADLENVFREFYQVGSLAPAGEKGFGLGLAIVSRLADLLGHELRVRSKSGRGSMFEVLVPAAAETVETGDEASRPAPIGDRRAFVLVIDDEPSVLDSTKGLLELYGHEVVSAAGAGEAVAALEASGRTPDLVISDYRLGRNATGVDALDQIRNRYGREIPGIVLTGDTSLSRLTRLGRTGGFAVLHKPVAPAELSRALSSSLGSLPASGDTDRS